MQILKSFLCAGAAAILISPLISMADTEAQIKARAAMEQRMRELQAQEPAATVAPVAPPARPQPAAPTRTTPPQQITRPPALPPPSMTTPPSARVTAAPPQAREAEAPPAQQPRMDSWGLPQASAASRGPVLNAPTPSSPEALEKAREALRQRMAELPAETVEAPAEVQPPRTARPGRRTFQDPEAPQTAAAPQEVPQTEAPAQAVRESRRRPQPEPAAQPAPARQARRAAQPASRLPEFPPLQGPPTGLSTSKEQRLQELLQAYREDRIRPDEYHAQRAKILSEP